VLDQLRGENMVLAMALSAGRPVELDGRELTIAFGEGDDFKRRKVDAESRAVAEAVRALTGAPVSVRVETREPEAEAEPQAGPTDEELVARFVAEFDAEEIVEDEEPS
jgi:DNA polymerase-3 subunit gamma/tau